MGINFFILFLIVMSIVLTNINIEEKKISNQYTNIPIVIFDNSTLYKITSKNVNRIINSSKALSYKNRDELYDATIISKNKSDNFNIISAEYVLKKKDTYKLYHRVFLEMESKNLITLQSDYVEFNAKKNIISTRDKFNLKINQNLLLGNDLYFDTKKEIMQAKSTNFSIQLNKGEQ